jgi:hypothetical protein
MQETRADSGMDESHRTRFIGQFREELQFDGAQEHLAGPKAESNLKNMVRREWCGRWRGWHSFPAQLLQNASGG